ncbi:Hypothetical predicted protein [Olea europaea subsp. europaea]|uniref:Uncharacterized protein n=1 Tax=Olea europaea subsp. europaea TaxID=158383 RepID=A0A8S0SQP9_OLEEU|nr:Hypothetical predicted protein [Olea europaea subsp. europaea]
MNEPNFNTDFLHEVLEHQKELLVEIIGAGTSQVLFTFKFLDFVAVLVFWFQLWFFRRFEVRLGVHWFLPFGRSWFSPWVLLIAFWFSSFAGFWLFFWPACELAGKGQNTQAGNCSNSSNHQLRQVQNPVKNQPKMLMDRIGNSTDYKGSLLYSQIMMVRMGRKHKLKYRQMALLLRSSTGKMKLVVGKIRHMFSSPKCLQFKAVI